MTPRMRILRGAFALAALAAMGSACQLALHAEGEDPLCNLDEGAPCPGSDLVCTDVVNGLGHCRPYVCKALAREICNGVDDNCDGQIDEGFDRDGDGYSECGQFNPDGTPVPNTIDCNDDPDTGGAAIHPGATELCNGIDDNCNNVTDEGTCPGQECWPLKPGCSTTGDCCTVKNDCRLHGCTALGCNPLTGLCSGADCTAPISLGGGCATGFTCDPVLKTCVKTPALGDPCEATDRCLSGECVDATPFGIARKVCSFACCTASDCPAGFVCKYSSTAASMCVKATDLGLQLGTAAASATCGAGKDCRSGVCTGSHCEDGCCGSPTCGSGGTCSLKTDSKLLCRDASGTADVGASCRYDTDCKTGLCMSYYAGLLKYCGKRCCTSFDCAADERCALAKIGTSSEVVPLCFLITSGGSGPGSKRGGETCVGGSECRSTTCNDGRCSETCCHDSDCDPATVCKPSASGPLRCLPKGA